MTLLLQPPKRKPTLPAAETPNRVVLHGVDWQTYCTVSDAFPEQRIRFTYDRGVLEIMTVSIEHERYKSLMNLLVVAVAFGLRRRIGSFGSFTHRRKDLLRALEPDLCFYLEHFAEVRGKRQIQLEQDPPPDLAIEIDISRSSLDRMAIYAALGVPELWRLENEVLRVYVLVKHSYVPRERSVAFPEIPIAELTRFLPVGMEGGDQEMMEAAQKWARRFKKAKKGK
jgi:Uma2 family endonuclease